MSTATPTKASASNSSATGEAASSGQNEDDLRKNLRQALQSLNRREPLEHTYKRLLLNGVVTSRKPVLPKDKFYKRVGSRLRERVENFMKLTEGKDPLDRIMQRQPLEEAAMRAALTLREAKEHEQQALLEATLAVWNGRDNENARKRNLEGVALMLQSKEKKKPHRSKSPPPTAAEKTEQARQQAELDRQRMQARAREAARKRRDEDERKRRDEELARKKNLIETPQQALHKLYQPIFRKLWDMEFSNLGGTNPFRIVIDRENCASMGAADYFDIIKTPMNLTYIQKKVDRMEYETLQAFFDDVELMIKNALTYNSDPSNPYRVAAEEMKKRYMKFVRKVLQTIQQKRVQQKEK